METHPPTAIITLGKFLPYVLELIYDSRESDHHTVIVVGDFDANLVDKAGSSIRVLKWADVEAEGAKGDIITSATPSMIFIFAFDSDANMTLQVPKTYSPSPSSHLSQVNYKDLISAMPTSSLA